MRSLCVLVLVLVLLPILSSYFINRVSPLGPFLYLIADKEKDRVRTLSPPPSLSQENPAPRLEPRSRRFAGFPLSLGPPNKGPVAAGLPRSIALATSATKLVSWSKCSFCRDLVFSRRFGWPRAAHIQLYSEEAQLEPPSLLMQKNANAQCRIERATRLGREDRARWYCSRVHAGRTTMIWKMQDVGKGSRAGCE
ncbi:hypothetical protein DFH09DRAFT_1087358 [Mycena vulgaris]|nr:hypothetical protein DFH09DRAFT_1087358 [Mycena vulgaris]